jgi:hypothetical protein
VNYVKSVKKVEKSGSVKERNPDSAACSISSTRFDRGLSCSEFTATVAMSRPVITFGLIT